MFSALTSSDTSKMIFQPETRGRYSFPVFSFYYLPYPFVPNPKILVQLVKLYFQNNEICISCPTFTEMIDCVQNDLVPFVFFNHAQKFESLYY